MTHQFLNREEDDAKPEEDGVMVPIGYIINFTLGSILLVRKWRMDEWYMRFTIKFVS